MNSAQPSARSSQQRPGRRSRSRLACGEAQQGQRDGADRVAGRVDRDHRGRAGRPRSRSRPGRARRPGRRAGPWPAARWRRRAGRAARAARAGRPGRAGRTRCRCRRRARRPRTATAADAPGTARPRGRPAPRTGPTSAASITGRRPSRSASTPPPSMNATIGTMFAANTTPSDVAVPPLPARRRRSPPTTSPCRAATPNSRRKSGGSRARPGRRAFRRGIYCGNSMSKYRGASCRLPCQTLALKSKMNSSAREVIAVNAPYSGDYDEGMRLPAPVEYAVAVDQYLDQAALSSASRRVYRISLASWAWPLVGKPVPCGAAAPGRGAAGRAPRAAG